MFLCHVCLDLRRSMYVLQEIQTFRLPVLFGQFGLHGSIDDS